MMEWWLNNPERIAKAREEHESFYSKGKHTFPSPFKVTPMEPPNYKICFQQLKSALDVDVDAADLLTQQPTHVATPEEADKGRAYYEELFKKPGSSALRREKK